jgi:hypothetical protein
MVQIVEIPQNMRDVLNIWLTIRISRRTLLHRDSKPLMSILSNGKLERTVFCKYRSIQLRILKLLQKKVINFFMISVLEFKWDIYSRKHTKHTKHRGFVRLNVKFLLSSKQYYVQTWGTKSRVFCHPWFQGNLLRHWGQEGVCNFHNGIYSWESWSECIDTFCFCQANSNSWPCQVYSF